MSGAEVSDASTQARKRWWPIMRHAYKIPEIVTDANAWSYLKERVGNALAAQIVLDLGEEGKFDEVLLLGETLGDGSSRLLPIVRDAVGSADPSDPEGTVQVTLTAAGVVLQAVPRG
jgi:hypothetical protein